MKFTDRLNALIGGQSSAPKKASAVNKFTPSINNITGKYPKNDNTKVIIGKANPKKKWSPKPGYKPSDGTGVGM